MGRKPDLLASYFTLAGKVSPLAASPVSPIDLRQRIEAAGKAGFRGIGLHGADLKASLGHYSYSSICAILDDNGMVHRELELLRGWFEPDDREHDQPDCEFLLEAAERLGARHIKAGTSGSALPAEAMAERFATLCEKAAGAATAIVLEYSPIGRLTSLAEAVALVQLAARDNGMLLLDIWHILRTGTGLDEIAALPPASIGHVELCDGMLRPVGPYLDDTVNRRLPCGEGDFAIAAFLASITASGYAGPYGVEILTQGFRTLAPETAAQRAFETCMNCFPAGDDGLDSSLS